MEDKEKSYETEMALQRKYAKALMRAKPGLGEKSIEIAEELMNTGLTPNEAMMVINIVYSPGRGQANKLKHFGKALVKRYGESYLEKVGQSPQLFKGFLYQIGQAVEMRDEVNGVLIHQTSISFSDALRFQELGLSPEVLSGYIYHLASERGISETAAIMRIKGAASEVERGNFATLEGILFRDEFDDMISLNMAMEDERTDERKDDER